MPKIEIDKERCKGCELCITYCPKSCIKVEGSINKKGTYPTFFLDKNKKCTGCCFCALICPEVCIKVYR